MRFATFNWFVTVCRIYTNIVLYTVRQHRLNTEIDLQSLFGLHVHSGTHWLRLCNLPPEFELIYEGAYWSDKVDDIFL